MKETTEGKVVISPENMKKVENAIGAAESMLATMGNNDSEFDRIKNIKDLFLAGDIEVDEAVNRITAIPWSKQQGAM